MPRKSTLLDICDLHDAASRLGVVWILDYSYVNISFAFAEGDVRRPITGGDFEYMQKFPPWRYLQYLAAEPLGNINVTLTVDLHAIGPKPPGVDLVSCEKVEQSEIRSVAQRTVTVYRELLYAVSHGLAYVEGLLVGRDAYSVRIIERICHLYPFIAAGREVEDFANHGCWEFGARAKYRGIGSARGGYHNIVYPAVKLLSLAVGLPMAQLLSLEVHFEDCAVVTARNQQCPLFRKRQAVMAATGRAIQNDGRGAIPF
jgi:hypothetical protein